MIIVVNGETREYTEQTNVADVIASMGLTGKKSLLN